ILLRMSSSSTSVTDAGSRLATVSAAAGVGTFAADTTSDADSDAVATNAMAQRNACPFIPSTPSWRGSPAGSPATRGPGGRPAAARQGNPGDWSPAAPG